MCKFKTYCPSCGKEFAIRDNTKIETYSVFNNETCQITKVVSVVGITCPICNYKENYI